MGFFLGYQAFGDRSQTDFGGIKTAAIVLKQEFKTASRCHFEFQVQRAGRRFANADALLRGLYAVYHRVADQLDGHVLDGRLIARGHQLQSAALEHHGLAILLCDQVGQGRERALQAAHRGHALCLRGAVPHLRHLGDELRRLDDLRAVLGDTRLGRRGLGLARRAGLRCQRPEQGELTEQGIELDRQRQKITAAQGLTAA